MSRGASRGTIAGRAHDLIRSSSLYAPVRRERLRRLAARPGYLPDWDALLAPVRDDWARAAAAAQDGPRVLIATSLGFHFTAATMDTLLAVALTWRGARVDLLLCDRALPACQLVDHALAPSVERYAARGPQADFCGPCFEAGSRTFTPLGLPVQRLSAWAGAARAGAPQSPDAVMAEHALAGTLRFFGREALHGDALERRVLDRYAAAAEMSARAAQALIAARAYDVVVAHHGVYVPQGLIADAAQRSGRTRLVTWHPSYRSGRFIYQHGDTYHRAMLEEPEARWSQPLSAEQESALDAYLAGRETGAQDWIRFQRSAPVTRAQVEAELGLSLDRPTALLLGSVGWDAKLHFPQNAYAGMADWAVQTVRAFAGRPDRQLVVRCHPGEVMSSPPAQDRLDAMIRAAVGELPPNVRIVPAESKLNTYSIARDCQCVFIYNTKAGVELAARGAQVAVAGDAWIRGKGFSHDAASEEEHLAIVERFAELGPMTPEAHARARRYAYHFFFRRCVPVDSVDPDGGWPLCSLRDDAATTARPGGDPGLDLICRGVLDNVPFEATE